MANIDPVEAIEDEDLGKITTYLNTATGLRNINKVYTSGGEEYTLLNRAKRVASEYRSTNTFAHKVLRLLLSRGAMTAEQLHAPIIVRRGLPPRHPIIQRPKNVTRGIRSRRRKTRRRV
jgi:hypothetical protein